MRLKLPKDCLLTEYSLKLLKQQIIYLTTKYEDIKDLYQVYLYADYLKIIYNNKSYWLTIISFNSEIYWYFKSFYASDVLIKYSKTVNIMHILNLIALINS